MKIIVCLAIVAALLSPTGVMAQVADQVEQKFDQMTNAIVDEQFDRARQIARELIKTNRYSDTISIRAYNHLLWSFYVELGITANAAEQKRLGDLINATAKEALLRYPSISAGTEVGTAGSIDLQYSTLRAQLFGVLQIETEPDSASLYINDEPLLDAAGRGTSPYFEPLYRAGSYTLLVSKDGYNDLSMEIEVKADQTNSYPLVLSRHRGKMWWLTRVGAPVVAVAGTIVALVVGKDEPAAVPEPEPLPAPPPPPSN